MSEKDDASGVGRKPKEIDLKTFESLCRLPLTMDEMALALNVSTRTLQRRLRDPQYNVETDDGPRNAYELAQSKGFVNLKMNLLTLGLRHSQMPNSAGVNAWIHLTKHLMGWYEKAGVELPKDGSTMKTIREALKEIEDQPLELPKPSAPSSIVQH